VKGSQFLRGNRVSTKTKGYTLIKDCLAVLLLLPAIGVALYHIKRAIYARVDEPIRWESASQTWLLLTAEFLIPLMIGAFIAWIVARRSRTRLGVELGILTTLTVYIVMYLISIYLPLLGCDARASFGCGEGAAFMLFQLIGMFIVNAVAMVGLGYWFNRLNKRRISPASQENAHAV
jgi:hypothetical protein